MTARHGKQLLHVAAGSLGLPWRIIAFMVTFGGGYDPKDRRPVKRLVWERVAASLWVLPAIFAVAAGALAAATLWVDRSFQDENLFLWSFPGDAVSVRSVLSTIASAMINFLALVFTITIVVLQLVSNRFTPRVLRTFLQDRVSQMALATFVATFTYAVVVLRTVEAESADGGFVPALSATGAFLLVLTSLAVFVRYIDHMARSIRISHITTSVGDDTAKGIERLYGDCDEDRAAIMAPSSQASVIAAGKKGVLVSFDENELVRWAVRNDSLIQILPRVGDFVTRQAPLIKVYAANAPDELREHVQLAEERELSNDPAFGFRQLVDIAERALSPGTVDPTTAVQALDQLDDLLQDVAQRPMPANRVFADADGNARVVAPQRTWKEFLDLAVDEVAFYGRDSLQVKERLRDMLYDVGRVAPPGRRASIAAKRHEVEMLWSENSGEPSPG